MRASPPGRFWSRTRSVFQAEAERGPSQPEAILDIDSYRVIGQILFAQACRDLAFAARRPAARRFLLTLDSSFWGDSIFEGGGLNMSMLRRAVELRCARPPQNTSPRPR
jgi:hypothetical protein